MIVSLVTVFIGCAENNETTYTTSPAQTYTTDRTATATDTGTIKESSTGMSNYDAAIDRARAENKPVYLLFTATWCGPCKNYKSTVLSDSEVRQSLNNDVIFVNADIDRDKALARKYNVSGVPTGFLVKVDKNGQARTVNSHVGGMDKQEFMSFIQK
jgi:thiol:disulfide interchange protein